MTGNAFTELSRALENLNDVLRRHNLPRAHTLLLAGRDPLSVLRAAALNSHDPEPDLPANGRLTLAGIRLGAAYKAPAIRKVQV